MRIDPSHEDKTGVISDGSGYNKEGKRDDERISEIYHRRYEECDVQLGIEEIDGIKEHIEGR
jgi:hypothetical protein